MWDDTKKMLEPTLTEAKEHLLKAGHSKEKVVTKVVTGVSTRAGVLIEETKKSGCGTIAGGRTGILQVEDFNIGRVANKVVHGAQNQTVWILP